MDSASPRPTASFDDSRSELGAPTLKITLAENFTFGGNNSRLQAFERATHSTFESADPPTMGAHRLYATR